MLHCSNFSVFTSNKQIKLVNSASLEFTGGKLHALIGPSGCGKTTLLKGILGMLPTEGSLKLNNQVIEDQSDLLKEVSFVPQFSIAHGKLKVIEAVTAALKLYTTLSSDERTKRELELLQLVGLSDRKDTYVEKLSGGQLRRLGLSLELATDPTCLLCDEVTSGLDPRSEDQILSVLRRLVTEQHRTVVCVIHNLAKLPQFDVVSVAYQGHIVFQGSYSELLSFFNLKDALDLYDRLAEHPLEYWTSKFTKPILVDAYTEIASRTPTKRASYMSQVVTLLQRRWLLFLRDKSTLLLTAALSNLPQVS
jgi:ABC transport system ATP-binding/permease protein